jgi:hypothetical protein
MRTINTLTAHLRYCKCMFFHISICPSICLSVCSSMGLSFFLSVHSDCPPVQDTKGGSITVLLTSRSTGLESAVLHLTIFVFIYKAD